MLILQIAVLVTAIYAFVHAALQRPDAYTAAEKLTNTRLYIERSALPPAEEDEYYLADLIGLPAMDAAGAALGTVAVVHDYGAGVSLEIAREAAPPLIVPFTREVVPTVDLAARLLVVVPPDETVVPGGEEAAA